MLTVNEAWDKYRNANGDEDRELFITRLNEMFETNTGEIGCIILSDFQAFNKPSVSTLKLAVFFRQKLTSLMPSLFDKYVNHSLDVTPI